MSRRPNPKYPGDQAINPPREYVGDYVQLESGALFRWVYPYKREGYPVSGHYRRRVAEERGPGPGPDLSARYEQLTSEQAIDDFHDTGDQKVYASSHAVEWLEEGQELQDHAYQYKPFYDDSHPDASGMLRDAINEDAMEEDGLARLVQFRRLHGHEVDCGTQYLLDDWIFTLSGATASEFPARKIPHDAFPKIARR